jgi:putative membrane protein
MAEPEKDPRVYFAAERTFLAWIRTGLALMGFGFVVARFGIFIQQIAMSEHSSSARSYGFSLWSGTGLVLLGVFVQLAAAARHVQVVNSLNRGDLLLGRPAYVALAVASILGIVGVAMVVFLIAVE